MIDTNIYFDEKGPTKTIRKSKHPENQFNFQDSDNIPAYLCIYLAIPKEQQDSFNSKYIALEQEYKLQNNFQASELKGEKLLKSVHIVQDIKKNRAKFFNDVIELIHTSNSKIQLSILDKSQVLVTSRLKSWLFQIEKLSSDTINIHLLLYTLIKYLRTEDYQLGLPFTNALSNSSLSTRQILDILKQSLDAFITNHHDIARMSQQIETYRQLISIINQYPGDNDIIPINFTFPTDQLAFGLDLLVLADNPKDWQKDPEMFKDTITIYLDADAPTNGYQENGYSHLKSGLDSKCYPGLRACDILAVLLGKLISHIDVEDHYDNNNPGEQKKLSAKFFKSLSSEQIKLVNNIYSLIFESNNKYSLLCGTFADYIYIFQALLETLLEYSGDNPENDHLFRAEKLMGLKFSEMEEVNNIRIFNLKKSTEELINDGIFKPL